jgi:hypothetical protein
MLKLKTIPQLVCGTFTTGAHALEICDHGKVKIKKMFHVNNTVGTVPVPFDSVKYPVPFILNTGTEILCVKSINRLPSVFK